MLVKARPRVRWEPFAESLALRLNHETRPRPGVVSLYWLGQAGFVVDSASGRFVVDPYLSDSLAEKYKGTTYPHKRMMEAPIVPSDLQAVDYVLCTHRHTDHMDPGTLQPMARANPSMPFVVPQASVAEAHKRCGVGLERLLLADLGRTLALGPKATVCAIASAHEELKINTQGHSEWLGYVLEVDGLRIYHSGDCVPYAGLVEQLRSMHIDVALLPVNGRDSERLGNGVPGNFTLSEAIDIAVTAGIPNLIAHHHGLFDFSTIAPQEIDAQIAPAAARGLQLVRARTGGCFSFETSVEPLEQQA